MLNSSYTDCQITYYLWKKINSARKMSSLILKYFSKSSWLISTFTWPVDYKKQESHCKSPLLTYGCTNLGVTHWLFLDKLRLRNLLNGSPTRRQITYYLQKRLKAVEKIVTSRIELFQQVWLFTFYIYMTSRLQKVRKPLQE